MPKSFIEDAFYEDGYLVQLWVDINEEGKIVAREKGAFAFGRKRSELTSEGTSTVEISDHSGEYRLMSDYYGRTPGLTFTQASMQKACTECWDGQQKKRIARHLKKLSEGQDGLYQTYKNNR